MNVCPNCLYKGEEDICPRDGFPMLKEAMFQDMGREPDLTGSVIGGKYEVCELLGTGAMGTVWRAVHRITKQEVALKVLKGGVHNNIQAVQRFLREARAASKLSHPNVIRVYDFGTTEDGRLFMVMELLKGTDLRTILKEDKSLDPLRAVKIAIQICEALNEAHQSGIVHRDLKPSNIFLVDVHLKMDFVKVIDFGISRSVQDDDHITGTGIVVGTPRYMSPEQAQGLETDARSDLYSLGIILYEMLSGDIPFKANTSGALLAAHIAAPPRPLPQVVKGVKIPESLVKLVNSLLAKKPENRPASALEVHSALCSIEAEIKAIVGDSSRSELQVRETAQSDKNEEQDIELIEDATIKAIRTGADNNSEERYLHPIAKKTYKHWYIFLGGLIPGIAIAVFIIMLIIGKDDATTKAIKDEDAYIIAMVSQQEIYEASHSKDPLVASQEEVTIEAFQKQIKRRVLIESIPKGALVFISGKKKPEGKTPITLEVDPDETLRLNLSLFGYHPAVLEIAPNTKNRYEVKMKKVEIDIPF